MGTLLNTARKNTKSCSWERLTCLSDTGENLFWKGLGTGVQEAEHNPRVCSDRGWEYPAPINRSMSHRSAEGAMSPQSALSTRRPYVHTASSLGSPLHTGYWRTGVTSGEAPAWLGLDSCPLSRDSGTGIAHPHKIKVCLLY